MLAKENGCIALRGGGIRMFNTIGRKGLGYFTSVSAVALMVAAGPTAAIAEEFDARVTEATPVAVPGSGAQVMALSTIAADLVAHPGDIRTIVAANDHLLIDESSADYEAFIGDLETAVATSEGSAVV